MLRSDVRRKDPLAARLSIAMVPGIGSAYQKRLSMQYSDPREIFTFEARDIHQKTAVPQELLDRLLNPNHLEEVLREIDAAHEHGIQILSPESPDYPESYRMLADPPNVLYLKGTLQAHEKRIAMVGTRSPSPTGLKTAREFARELGFNGVAIVSGLAHGIDTASHEGALEAGGRTYAVLGSGLLNLYPLENRNLAQKIQESGGLISEFHLHAEPIAHHFPQRNRLISALAHAALIVEAPKKSGALITADYALEQGKDVFALPASILNSRAEGTNRLIQQGAGMALVPQDILDAMGWKASTEASDTKSDSQTGGPDAVLDLLSIDEPVGIDELLEGSGLDAGEVLRRLCDLEIKGRVRWIEGNRYLRT